MNDTDHVAEARAFVDNLPNDDGYISGYTRNGVQYRLAAEGLHAILAELEQLRADRPGRGFLAQAYANGWCDAIAAYRAPGWVEREAGWKKYLAEVDGDGPWIVSQQARQVDAAPQQPELPTRRSALLTAIQREGGDWSPLRARTALVSAGYNVESNRAHEIMKTLAAHGYLEQVRPRAHTYRLKTEAVQQPAQNGEAEQ